MRKTFPVFLCLFLLAACAQATQTPSQAPTEPPAESGIEGQSTIGPACPVVKIDEPCPDQPYQATLSVLDSSGNQVTQFTTDENGQFRINLAPGEYILHAELTSVMPTAEDVPFTVSSGQFTTVNIVYDSGIR